MSILDWFTPQYIVDLREAERKLEESCREYFGKTDTIWKCHNCGRTVLIECRVCPYCQNGYQ